MRTNPFIDLPMTLRRFLLQVASAVVFFGEIFYGIYVGLTRITLRRGPVSEATRFDIHRRIQQVFRWNIKAHPWLSLTVDNPHGETFERGSIIICNHQSTLDPLCLLPLSPRILMVMNEKVWHTPVVSRVFRYADYFPLASSMEERLEYFRDRTSRGYSVIVFAEGMRSRTCSIRRFHQGPLWIAEQLGIDILPIVIHGPGHVMPVGVNYSNHAALHVEIGQRIKADDRSWGDDMKARTRSLHRYFQEHYEALCQRTETAAYFRYFLPEMFSHIGLRRQAERELRAHDGYVDYVDAGSPEQLAFVEGNDLSGVITLLYALVHPDTTVVHGQPTAQANLRRLYARCPNLPPNIQLDA